MKTELTKPGEVVKGYEVGFSRLMFDFVKQILTELLLVFPVLCLVVIFFYYRDAVALGFIADGRSRAGDILELAWRMSLLYVVFGYGVALFFYRTLVKPYLWKLFALKGVLIRAKDLLVVQAYVLLSLVLATADLRLALHFTDDDRGRRHFGVALANLRPEEVFWSCFLISILALFILRYQKSPFANWRTLLVGLLLAFGLASTGLAPTYSSAYADSNSLYSEHKLLYQNEYLAVLADSRTTEELLGRHRDYGGKIRVLKEKQLEALLMMIKLARNNNELAEAYYSLAVFAEQNYTSIKSEQYNIAFISYLLDDANGWINEMMARLSIARNQYDNAIMYAKRCTERINEIIDPTHCYDPMILGHWYKGDTEKALAAAREVYERYPNWPRALWWRDLMEVLAVIYRLTPESLDQHMDEMTALGKSGRYKSEEYMILDVQRLWGQFTYGPAEKYFQKLFAAFPNSVHGRVLYDRFIIERDLLDEVLTASVDRGFYTRKDSLYQILVSPIHGMSL